MIRGAWPCRQGLGNEKPTTTTDNRSTSSPLAGFSLSVVGFDLAAASAPLRSSAGRGSGWRMACRYSARSRCSFGVWSRLESPGPYATMGQFQAGPTTFMSEVPLLTLNAGSRPSARMAWQERPDQRRVLLGAVGRIGPPETEAGPVGRERLDLALDGLGRLSRGGCGSRRGAAWIRSGRRSRSAISRRAGSRRSNIFFPTFYASAHRRTPIPELHRRLPGRSRSGEAEWRGAGLGLVGEDEAALVAEGDRARAAGLADHAAGRCDASGHVAGALRAGSFLFRRPDHHDPLARQGADLGSGRDEGRQRAPWRPRCRARTGSRPPRAPESRPAPCPCGPAGRSRWGRRPGCRRRCRPRPRGPGTRGRAWSRPGSRPAPTPRRTGRESRPCG